MTALRRATPADAEAIRELVRATYARWVPAMGREPVPMLVDYAEAAKRHVIDLHHVGADLVALIEYHAAVDHLFIVNVAVAPAHQGCGMGRNLLAHAERVAVSLGLDKMRLFTNEAMTQNAQLYRHLGYRVEREEAFRGGVVLHMGKTL